MKAFPPSPPRVPEEVVSGLSCPECFGVLNVSTEGPHSNLRFRCRSGHLYSADDVLMGKEHVVEVHLWGAVTALAELAAFLRDLIATERAGGQQQAFEERAKHAHDLEARLRGIIEDNEPVALENGGTADKGVE